MSDEFARWNELAKLWRAHTETISSLDVERHARRQRRHMRLLVVAEATAMALAFAASAYIAIHTAMFTLSSISIVSVAVSAFLQHRVLHEPAAFGTHDLLSSLRQGIEREDWNLKQLRVGRAVTLATLLAIGIVTADHLARYASTPPSRSWALLSVTLIVVTTLVFNWQLTRQSLRRKACAERFAAQLNEA